MSLVVGENSWCTIAEADEILKYKLGSEEWYELSDETSTPGEESKELFLRNSYDLLLNKVGYAMSPTITDAKVKKAQALFAFIIFDGSFLDESQLNLLSAGVSGMTLSKWRVSYFESWSGDFPLPYAVANLLSDYVSGYGEIIPL